MDRRKKLWYENERTNVRTNNKRIITQRGDMSHVLFSVALLFPFS